MHIDAASQMKKIFGLQGILIALGSRLSAYELFLMLFLMLYAIPSTIYEIGEIGTYSPQS